MTGDLKTTPLHAWHVENGANMASFASYDMPLWYPAGVKNEHLAVIGGAGLFDTSHMALNLVSGKDARELLQRCFSKDVEQCVGLKKTPLVEGRCVYGVFLNDSGHVIDDAIVYQITQELYMLVVNAGMGAAIAEHLSLHRDGLEVDIGDLTDRVGKIDLQGPAAAKIMGRILAEGSAPLEGMGYFTAKGWFSDTEPPVSPVRLQDETPILFSRTGYTGEFGFELFLPPEKLLDVWEMILGAGQEFGISPCGLAARDSLRAGAVLPLSHQDIGDWLFALNPWEFALPRGEEGEDFTKTFLGVEALKAGNVDGYTLPFAGFDPRKITPGEGCYVTDESGENIGTILTCATDMAIGRVEEKIVSLATPTDEGRPEGFAPRGLSCGFIRVNRQLPAGDVVILTDGKRKIKVEIREDIRPNRTARIAMKKMI